MGHDYLRIRIKGTDYLGQYKNKSSNCVLKRSVFKSKREETSSTSYQLKVNGKMY